MEKAEILAAIQKCALDNGGRPLGRERFEAVTGITETMWIGRYWVRWNEAVTEAGYEPGAMNAALPEKAVLGALASLVRELGHYPTNPELKMRRRNDPSFPSANVFTRFGSKAHVAARLVEHCGEDPTWADVASIADAVAAGATRGVDRPDGDEPVAGQVYLMKSGAHYKIGRSNASGRRAYELAIQLPDKLEVLHVIDTDDAVGIERYWHKRFADRRANGEWFSLTTADVVAFKRRKRFM